MGMRNNHALTKRSVLAAGLSKQLAPVQNNWGDASDIGGYFWMSFEVIAALDTDLCRFTRVGPRNDKV